jgi:5-formyltetrahydrofolate cyclo-ligase
MDDFERAMRGRAKEALRGRMRGIRRVLPLEACAARSRALCDRVQALPELAAARVIVGYVALRKEADPAAVLDAARRAHQITGLVRVLPDSELALLRHDQDAALVENEYGILEPGPDAQPIAETDVDVILVPALAADADGNRIGSGRGYYDRLLPRLPRAFKIALVYDFQLLAEAPVLEHDAPVDCVVTDDRVLRKPR